MAGLTRPPLWRLGCKRCLWVWGFGVYLTAWCKTPAEGSLAGVRSEEAGASLRLSLGDATLKTGQTVVAPANPKGPEPKPYPEPLDPNSPTLRTKLQRSGSSADL